MSGAGCGARCRCGASPGSGHAGSPVQSAVGAIPASVACSASGTGHEAAEAIIAGAAFCLPFGLWTTRNALVFGRFIPLSTSGIGVSLYLNKLEWTIGSPLDGEKSKLMSQEMQQVAGADILSVAGNRALRRER